MSAAVGTDYVVGFCLQNSDGTPRTGETAITPRVRCLDTGVDDASVAAVTEIGNGRYSLTIRGAFSTAQGAGAYAWAAEVTAVGTEDLVCGQVDVQDIEHDALPGAVWDETASSHQAAGSTGLAQLLGLYHDGAGGLAIHINPGSGVNGTTVGVNGTSTNPVRTEADALSLASALGIRRFKLDNGTLTLTQAYSDWMFLSDGRGFAFLNLTGTSLTGCIIQNLFVAGNAGGGFVTIRDSSLAGVTNLQGVIFRCNFQTSLGINGGTILQDCRFQAGPSLGQPIPVDFAGLATNVTFRDFSGEVTVRNLTGGNVEIGALAGRLTFEASCTGGNMQVAGIAELFDNSAGMTLDDTGVVSPIEQREILDWLKNRRAIDFGAGPPRQFVLYERDGVTEKFRADLLTQNGTEVLAFFGVQHERGQPT